jgi:hypothetical protein
MPFELWEVTLPLCRLGRSAALAGQALAGSADLSRFRANFTSPTCSVFIDRFDRFTDVTGVVSVEVGSFSSGSTAHYE